MSSPTFYKSLFKQIYVLKSVKNHPVVTRVLEQLDTLPCKVITNKEAIPSAHLNQYTLLLNAPQAIVAGPCPGSRGHFCCNYLTIDLYTGCILGCSYCIMQSYLNFSPISVNVDIEKTITYVIELARQNPDTKIRIGTGEVGDSLLYDPLFQLSGEIITAFAPYPNIMLELKTKTGFVHHLLSIENKGNAVIGFSLNPQILIDSEEGTAASLAARLAAAREVVSAGYHTAFHFDPIIHYADWEKDYPAVVDALQGIPGEKIAWISLGTFRYPPALKNKIAARWYLYAEFVLCKDKKYRYLQKFRTDIYRKMVEKIKKLFPEVPVYLCMESIPVWENVFSQKPRKIFNLCDIIKRVVINK